VDGDVAMRLEQSQKYLDVVRRFGRLPHRNAVLGRSPSRAEMVFLQDWKEKRPRRACRRTSDSSVEE